MKSAPVPDPQALKRLYQKRNQVEALLSDPIRRFQLSIGALLALVVVATLVYMILEQMSLVDALYMTIITLATVGFSEVKPLTDFGRIFTILLILLGIGTATAAVSNALNVILGPRLWDSVLLRNLERERMSMTNHTIICGYGRMGRQVARDLKARGEPFIVIDRNSSSEEALLEARIPFLIGDATRDEPLIEAGIERARGLVAALSSDPDNVMTVLTARELNPKLFIIARVVHQEATSKLRRAGANRVINPYQIGGHRIAVTLLRPAVHDFLSYISDVGSQGTQPAELGQVEVDEASPLAGKSIAESNLRRDYGVNVIALRDAQGTIQVTPAPQTVLEPGTTLIVIGTPQMVARLENRHQP